MPIYEFVNVETGQVFEEMMSISSLDDYLKNNPNISRYYSSDSAPSTIYRASGMKPTSNFRDRLTDIKKRNKNSTINNF